MERRVFNLLLAALLLVSSTGWSKDIYVSPGGSDDTGAGTMEAPWQTLAHAVGEAGKADTIHLAGDGDELSVDYVESVVITANLDGLSIRGSENGEDFPLIKVASDGFAVSIQASDVTLVGLEISGQNPAKGIEVAAGAEGTVLDKCRFSNAVGGLLRAVVIHEDTGSTTISGGLFKGHSYGLWTETTQASNVGLTVTDCTFLACTAAAELQYLAASTFSGNVFEQGSHALKCSHCPGTTFADNELKQNTSNGLYLYASPDSVVENNSFAQKGVHLSSSQHTTVTGNTFDQCVIGIDADSNSRLVIRDNIFANGGNALKFNNTEVLLADNEVSGHSTAAVKASNGSGLMVFNHFHDNDGVAFDVSNNNALVFANWLVSNGGGNFTGTNQKNLCETPIPLAYEYDGQRFGSVLGNSHGDYAGEDEDGDGLGDTELPHPAIGDGDFHPLTGAADDYAFEFFSLTGDGHMSWTGQMPNDLGIIQLAPGESTVFAAQEPTVGHLVYAPLGSESERWHIYLPAGVTTEEPVLAEIGFADGEGNAWFGSDGPIAELSDPGNLYWISAAFSDSFAVVPNGKYLALRITANSSKYFTVWGPGALLSPPAPAGPAYGEGGQNPAQLVVTEGDWNLGEIEFGQSYALELTVTNGGQTDMMFEDFVVIGPDANELTIDSYGCPWPGPMVRKPGENCQLSLTFSPGSGGPKSAGLVIQTDDAATPYFYVDLTAVAGPQHEVSVTIDPPGSGSVSGPGIDCPDDCTMLADEGASIALTATPADDADFVGWEGCTTTDNAVCSITASASVAVTALFAPFAPDLSLSPDKAEFDETFVAETSPQAVFELANVGKEETELDSVVISGLHPDDFELVTNSCGATIPVGGSCTLVVVFKPQAEGQREAELVVTSDDFDTPQITAPLSGTASIKPRTLTVLVLPPTAGTVSGEGIACPGDCEETFPNTVTASLELVVADGYKVLQWNGCDQVQGTTCTVTVESDMVVTVALARKLPMLHVEPPLIDFGDIEVGQASAPIAATLANVGDGPLTFKAAGIAGLFGEDFAISADTCSDQTIGSGKSCFIEVVFTPAARNVRGATLRVGTSDFLHPVAELALVGRGLADVTKPEFPPQPLSGDPLLRVLPGSLNFGVDGLWNMGSILNAKVCNYGGGAPTVTGLTIGGDDAQHFTYEDYGCDGDQLLFGMCCGANFFFAPQTDGEKRGKAIFAIEGAEESEVEVQLVGVGGSYQKPSNTSTKQERGCSASLDRPASPAALLLLLLALLLPCLLRHVRYSVLLLCLLLGSGGTVTSLTGCDANPTGTCLGEFELTGTGIFEPFNETFRFMLSSSNLGTGCSETHFLLIEDVQSGGYINNENFTVSLYLQSPLFPGRRYGKGTELIVTRRGNLFPEPCFIAEGYVEVGDLLMREKPEACNATMELKFNIDDTHCGGIGTPGWEGIQGKGSSLKGWGQFSYGMVQEECAPPPVEDVGDSPWAGKVGQHIFPPGLPDPYEEMDLPVAWMGTEVNGLTGEHLFMANSTVEDGVTTAETATLTVDPPADSVGNWLCECPHSNQYPHPRCLDHEAHDAFTAEALLAEEGGDLFLPLCDRFGIRPTIELDWDTGPPPPVISAPLPAAEFYVGDPLTLTWEAAPDFGEGTVVVRAWNADYLWNLDDEPVFEFATDDSGTLVLDPAMLSTLEAETVLAVERSHVTQPDFNIPLRSDSSVLVRKVGRVSVKFKPGSSLVFPDPDEPVSGWTTPEEVGSGSLDFWIAGAPVADVGPDGLLHVAWMDSLQPDYRVFDTTALEWVEPAYQSGIDLNNGPLGLRAQEGAALLWGFNKTLGKSEYRPAAYLWSDKVVGGVLEGADVHEKNWPTGGTLLADGTVIMGWTNSDELLYWSIGLEPLSMLGEGHDATWGDSTFFPRSDGMVAVFVANHPSLLVIADPVGNTTQSFGLGTGYSVAPCPDKAAVDAQDVLHFVCLSKDAPHFPQYWSNSLFGGDYVSTPEAVSQDPVLYERYADHKVVTGRDGSIWLLWLLECDDGQCPLLFKRLPSGTWMGPYFGGQATGGMDMAVDTAGRVHLIFMRGAFEGNAGQTPVYHTYTEVAP